VGAMKMKELASVISETVSFEVNRQVDEQLREIRLRLDELTSKDKPDSVTFGVAASALLQGCHIRRRSEGVAIKMGRRRGIGHPRVLVQAHDETPYMLTDQDIAATDWEIT